MSKKTHYGFQIIDEQDKQEKVQKVFFDVAAKYDLMNDLMSMGLHRIWKNKLITEMHPQKNDILLDLAGGTGDIAHKFLQSGGHSATVCDLNDQMLQMGINKTIDNNLSGINIKWVCANAEELPFADDQFDYCTIAFGIRNVTNIKNVLNESYRVLKPGGKFLCLEFSHIDNPSIAKLYDTYSFKIIPKLGSIVTGNAEHYQYLVESIRQFPKAHIFAKMLKESNFKFVNFIKLTFGIVAIHSGYKI